MRNPKNTLVRNSTDLKHLTYLRKVKEELNKDQQDMNQSLYSENTNLEDQTLVLENS